MKTKASLESPGRLHLQIHIYIYIYPDKMYKIIVGQAQLPQSSTTISLWFCPKKKAQNIFHHVDPKKRILNSWCYDHYIILDQPTNKTSTLWFFLT